MLERFPIKLCMKNAHVDANEEWHEFDPEDEDQKVLDAAEEELAQLNEGQLTEEWFVENCDPHLEGEKAPTETQMKLLWHIREGRQRGGPPVRPWLIEDCLEFRTDEKTRKRVLWLICSYRRWTQVAMELEPTVIKDNAWEQRRDQALGKAPRI